MAPLGNFVRLLPLHINEVPDHSALHSLIEGPKGTQAPTGNSSTNGSVTRPGLRQFITHIFNEASQFADHTIPDTFKNKGPKKSPPAAHPVELLTRAYSHQDIYEIPWQNPHLPRQWSGNAYKEGENWFARRSRHSNQSQGGTATFSELDEGLRQNHSKHEQDYTPEVYDHHDVLSWDEAIRMDVERNGQIQGDAGHYTDVQMGICEMCHKLPPPLSCRVFPVLVLTAKGPRKHSFIVVQIPIDISNLTSAFYSNKRNRHEGDNSLKRKNVVLGAYTSIETGQILPDQNVEWLMATASDAKGWLPMWIQKLGVPGAVVKDVGLFMKWILGVRRGLGKDSDPSTNRSSSGGPC